MAVPNRPFGREPPTGMDLLDHGRSSAFHLYRRRTVDDIILHWKIGVIEFVLTGLSGSHCSGMRASEQVEHGARCHVGIPLESIYLYPNASTNSQ
jgi:hypothetical protein